MNSRLCFAFVHSSARSRRHVFARYCKQLRVQVNVRCDGRIRLPRAQAATIATFTTASQQYRMLSMYARMYIHALRAGRHRALSTNGRFVEGQCCFFCICWSIRTTEGPPLLFHRSLDFCQECCNNRCRYGRKSLQLLMRQPKPAPQRFLERRHHRTADGTRIPTI